METLLTSRGREVVVSIDRPFVVIGERINPTGRKVLAAEMKAGRMDRVRADAIALSVGVATGTILWVTSIYGLLRSRMFLGGVTPDQER